MRISVRAIVVCLWVGVVVSSASAVETVSICLNGRWDKAREVVENQKPEAWQTTTIPEVQNGNIGPFVWYRRVFELGEVSADRRYVLRFEKVNFTCTVFLNGREVGRNFGGCTMFEFDAGDFLQAGENELAVRVGDAESIRVSGVPVGKGVRFLPEDHSLGDKAFVGPSTSVHTWYWGIVDDVTLCIFPRVRVADIYAIPEVEADRLRAEVLVENGSAEGGFDGAVELAVTDVEGNEVLRFEPVECNVAVGEETAISAGVEVAERLRLWWPHDPQLYYLAATVRDARGEVVHRERVRFGYRQFRVDGERFRLNGVPTILRGTSLHYSEGGREAFNPAGVYDLVRRGGAQIVRLHCAVRPNKWYRIADETGMLLVCESSLNGSHQHNALQTELFFETAQRHICQTVRRLRNHPSIVIWSLSNEVGLDGSGRITDGILASIYEEVRAIDDSRPYTAEGDGDLGGVLPIIGIHAWWNYNQPMYPESTYWFESMPVRKDYREVGDLPLRGKPVYIGEFSTDWIDMRDPLAILAGDRAYLDWAARRGARGEIIQRCIEGHRWTGVAGIAPWTMFEQLNYEPPYVDFHRRGMRPIALVVRDVNAHFYGGSSVERRIMAMNDSLSSRRLRFAWALKMGERVLDEGEEEFELAPAGRQRLDRTLAFPEVSEPTAVSFVLTLSEGGEVVDAVDQTYRVFPRPAVEAALRDVTVLLYEPEGNRTADALEALGVKVVPASLDMLRNPPVDAGPIVVGEGSGDSELQDAVPALCRFVEAGGVVVSLYQGRAFCPPDLVLFSSAEAHAVNFVRSAGHPIWSTPWAVGDEDLRWWGSDLAVCEHMFAKPKEGAFRVLADGGFGNNGTSFVELVRGRGSWLATQLKVVEKFEAEPMAAEVLRRTVRYAVERAAASGRRPRVAVWADEGLVSFIRQRTDQMTVLAEVSPESLEGCDVLIAGGGRLFREAVERGEGVFGVLKAFVQRGGRLYIHDLPARAEYVLTDLLPGLTWDPVWGHQVVRGQAGLLTEGLGNSDLCWQDDGFDVVSHPEEIGADLMSISGARALTDPALLQELVLGDGAIYIDQIDWLHGRSPRARRVGHAVLTNLGLTSRWQALDAIGDEAAFVIDLSGVANRGLADDQAGDGAGGWTDQGGNDMRQLPKGRHLFAGIPFHIISEPPNQAVILAGGPLKDQLPRSVRVPVGRTAVGLAFLHGAAWIGQGKSVNKSVNWRYVVRYADGSAEDVEVRCGVHVLDWWASPSELPGARVGWSGANAMRSPVTLYVQAWRNPQPEKAIAAIDLVSEDNGVPFVLGITGLAAFPEWLDRKEMAVVREAPPQLPLDFAVVGEPVTVSAGPTSLTVDSQGNITDWRVDGRCVVERMVFGPCNSNWHLPANTTVQTRMTELPDGSKVILIDGTYDYLQAGQEIVLRPDGRVLLMMRADVLRDVAAEEFVCLRYYVYLSKELAGGAFNNQPLPQQVDRRVVAAGRGATPFVVGGPDGRGLGVEHSTAEFMLFDYRQEASAPPRGWDLTVDVPFDRTAGSSAAFRLKAAPMVPPSD